MKKLTQQEEMVMKSIWQIGLGAVRDFIEVLPEPHPPYTTVASIVKNLEKKGYLSSRKFGNTYVYLPIVTEEKYKARFLSNFVNDYFENSYQKLVSFFAKDERISAEELKEIVNIIEKKDKK
ncbi:MAG: transcriptional regulator [Bacteroidetes bacterium]|nr:MAG: transcriptional regulator [Bacteroidota bacterium]